MIWLWRTKVSAVGKKRGKIARKEASWLRKRDYFSGNFQSCTNTRKQRCVRALFWAIYGTKSVQMVMIAMFLDSLMCADQFDPKTSEKFGEKVTKQS